MITCATRAGSRVNFCSRAAAGSVGAWRRANMRGWYWNGSPASGWVAAIMLATVAAQAEQRNFTEPDGRYQGSAVTRGGSTSFTDQRGNFAGSAITRDGKTDFYDRNGRYQGTTTTRPPKH